MRLLKISITLLGICLLAVACSKSEDKPNVVKSSEKQILSFNVSYERFSISEDGTIRFTFPYGTDISWLTPTIEVSEKATVEPASGKPQNFSNTQTYVVTAEDGTTKSYRVTVSIAAKEYRVGDYYPSANDPSTATGVVCYVFPNNKSRARIISLDETRLIKWSTEKVLTNVENFSTGKAKTAHIKETRVLSSYPAFKWCVDKGDGWYLPSNGELNEMRSNIPTINTAIEKISNGAAPIHYTKSVYYWSSSESLANEAYSVPFSRGTISGWLKIGKDVTSLTVSGTPCEARVRAMMDIN